MPNPKRRHSKRRTSARRTHDSLRRAILAECPNHCQRELPSFSPSGLRTHCGKYKGREVVEVAEEQAYSRDTMLTIAVDAME